jgi:N-methylhydantoinase A
MSHVVGIDIGGTFTDGVAIDLTTSVVTVGKSPTTYPDPFEGVSAVLDELAAGHELSRRELLSSTTKFVHGTTLTSNVLLERRGAKVGLVATEGHADAVLMMSGKGRVAGLSLMERRHFRATDKPDPIVPRANIVEASERIDLDGDIVLPLSDEVIDDVVRRVSELDVEACAVALLWSFRNSEHEQRIADALRSRLPELFVSVSSDLAPLLGEYERTATAVVNSYVGPAVTEYLRSVEQSLRDEGLRSPLQIVQSSGGIAHASETNPVSTIESGPAAGVRGTAHLLEQVGLDHAVVTDVGGTTFKVTIVRDRQPELTTETVLGQYSLLVPMIDVVSIGTGGGSIAWVDGQRLRVGPQSAASNPGPACYGWGGTQPTVTDADLVLGYLNPDYFLGGRMELHLDAATEAIRTEIAEPLFGGDVLRAAAGIREVIDTQMADLIRKASTERGHDLREFAVLAYGGAGPVHCGAYASELDCPKIVIPPNATVFSAFGAAISDVLHSYSISRQQPAPGNADAIRDDLVALESRARDVLQREGLADEAITLSAWADVRYRRQFYELRVPLEGPVAELDAAALRGAVAQFEADYARRYGAGARHGEDRVEFVRFGIEAVGATERPTIRPVELGPADAAAHVKGQRDVYWREAAEAVSTPIYDGPALRPGATIAGPAVIEHPGTAIAVHHGQVASIDPYFNTIIDNREERRERRRADHL